jgi:hypothetical protein
MNDGHEPAYPHLRGYPDGDFMIERDGLTKREVMATAMMAALVAFGHWTREETSKVAQRAVQLADELLEALNPDPLGGDRGQEGGEQ